MSLVKTNDLKKGTRVRLANGWYATLVDNARGNARMANVEGYVTEIGSVYAHDIVEGNVADDLDLPQLAEKTVSYLMTFKDNIVSCEVASSHLGVLDALAKIENSDWVRQQVSLTAGSYAKRNWQTAEGKDKGAVFNAQVTDL